MSTTAKVVIVGGGFAGLETAFVLRHHLGGDVRISVVADREDFLFKPNTIYLPFGGDEDKLHIGLDEPFERRDIDFHHSEVAEIDSAKRRVRLADGEDMAYDYLVLATGAAMRPEEIPGLAEYAQTIWTPEQMHALGGELERLHADVDKGADRKVLFLVPPGNKCAGPLYEIVFMLETWLRNEHLRDHVSIEFTTYERSYIQAFGERLNAVVSIEFAERGITGHQAAVATEVRDGEVAYADGTVRAFDLLIAFPPYVAAVEYPGLPTDDRGFLLTESETRRVRGHDRIYAPGDAGDFPVKQAFLAFLQADAVADDIAYRIDPRTVPHPRRFEPVSMCVMEMFDKATFAQVPLETTGDPAAPVRVRADVPQDYRVGVSPLWRLGKKTLGLYLPMQFRAGRPFHDGFPWHAMEFGLKGMSHALATSAVRKRSTAAAPKR